MGQFKDIGEARAFFAGDLYAMNSGVTLDELGEDWCVCSMAITSGHKNAMGGVMGGAIFTLGDLALAAVSNNLHKMTVAQQVSVNFLSGAKGDRLIARARCIKNGRASCVVNIDIEDDLGRLVAQMVGTGFKL